MTILDTFSRYNAALATGDFATINEIFSDDIVWHQPGSHDLAGPHTGKAAVNSLLGSLMERSAGTLNIRTNSIMLNGDLVATTVAFTATRPNSATVSMAGVDIFRIVDSHIVEVWLFSEDQAAEDAFWADAS